eukprot:11835162-Ditylum_brightwellii.AAC.1
MSPRQQETVPVDCHHCPAYPVQQYMFAVDCHHLCAFFKAVTKIMPTLQKTFSIDKKFIEAFQQRGE